MTHDTATLTRALGIAKRIDAMKALRRDLKRHGIRQTAIALKADVDPSLVAHVLAGRALSSKVVGVARAMVADAEGLVRIARARRRDGR